jgi:long-chain acyl-CoA synthetase
MEFLFEEHFPYSKLEDESRPLQIPFCPMSNRTLYSLLEEAAKQHGKSVALYQPTGSKTGPKYRDYTWTEYRDSAREIASGLRSLGIGKGDVVALASETRAEFYIADLGVISNGSIAAALYTSLPPHELVPNIVGSEAKAVFVEDAEMLKALRNAGAPGDPLIWIVLTGTAEGAITLDDLRQRGRAEMTRDPAYFDRVRDEVSSDDPAILYLTSGATGVPKMGLATHAAVLANVDMAPAVLPLGPKDRTLVFLPSAHIAQRIVLQMLPLRCCVPVYFSEGLSKMPAELRAVRPTFFLAPPRVWERMYASVTTEIRKRSAFSRKMFYGALGLGLKAGHLRHEGKPVPPWMQRALKAADRLVFSRIRARLGGQLRVAASGAAPLGKDLAQFFEAINLPLIEGYGLTEGGVATLNPLDRPRAGSIGKPLPGVHIRLAADGELLIKSPCLFSGYFHDPEATAAVLQNGWLHTGDIAEVDSDGYVYITGRKKELIVSSNGKKIYPSRIESLFKMEPVINQVILVGDHQPYVTALFTLNPAAPDVVEELRPLKGKTVPELAKERQVIEAVDQAVKRANKQLAPFEQIKRFRILDRDFSIEHGEVTPTMKVRRQQVLENFRTQVNDLYN